MYSHKKDGPVACSTAKDGMKSFIKFFIKCLDRNVESDGILLVLLHREHLMDLMRELWLMKNSRYVEKFFAVKGVCFIEDIVRLTIDFYW